MSKRKRWRLGFAFEPRDWRVGFYFNPEKKRLYCMVLPIGFYVEAIKRRRSGPRPGARCVPAVPILDTTPTLYRCTACNKEGVPKRGHTTKRCSKPPEQLPLITAE